MASYNHVSASQLDRELTILTYAPSTGSMGGAVEAWTEGETVFCARKDMSGREFLAAGQIAAQGSARFIIRWREDIGPKDRVRCEDVEYDIVNLNELGRHEGLEITGQARR
jgi:SPP1 family predicted phage head-tail adaptor